MVVGIRLLTAAATGNLVMVRDGGNEGVPTFSGTNAFTVLVNPLTPVLLTPLGFSGGQFQIQINGPTGLDYFILASTNLTDWLDISTNLSPATPFQFSDADAGSFTNRAFRARLGP